VITQVVLSVHYYPRPLRLGVLAQVWTAALVFFAIGFTVQWPSLWVSILAKIVLVAAASVALARLGFGAGAFAAMLARLSGVRPGQG
jgi:hypothetical protein